jgi:hypothetical protein
MRKLSFALVIVLAVAVAGQAQAIVIGATGSVAVSIAGLSPLILPGSASVTVNGSGPAGHLTALQVPAGVFAISGLILPVTDPAAFPIAGLQVTGSNMSAAFGGSGGAGFGGASGLNGGSKVCLFGPCSAATANITVPLAVVGGGGVATVMGAVNLTVVGAPWTTGTVAVGTVTQMGFAMPASNTAAPGGTVQLVTPIFISTNIGASAVLPGFAFMTLSFVPEPGTLLLLGSGIAGLVAFGRSRAKK